MTRPIPVFPDGRQELYKTNRYSAAIRSGDLLFVSGQVGSREDGSPEPDLAAQIRLAFRNLEMVLDAAGCTVRDVVDVTSFHVDPESHVELMLSIKDEVFPGPDYPNWTAVGVTWLSGFQFEIKAIARIPEAR